MKYFTGLFLLLFLFSCNREPEHFPVVKVAGSMKNVTELNDKTSKIYLDSIYPHQHLYGLGPLAEMSGEILIIDGRPYASKINKKRRNKIRQTYDLYAPYFVYTHVRGWDELTLPDSIINRPMLENYIGKLATERGKNFEKPFPFMITGNFQEIIYNIPYQLKKDKPGKKPAPNTVFSNETENAVVLGFYSKKHQGIFTEPGSNTTMSFMTTNATKIGQIDQLTFHGKKVQLLLPR